MGTSAPICLITGASRGIGAAVAVRLAKEGYELILAARDKAGLEQTDDAVRTAGGKAWLVQLDLTDSAQIEALSRAVFERYGRLDVLIGNAGVLGEITPIADSTPGEWEKTMTINVTANMHLIRCFDPLLKRAENPRAMFVTSGITEAVYPYWNAYAVSKCALDMMVKLYAAENEKTTLRANLISPGIVRTRMRAQAMPGEDPDTLTPPEAMVDIFLKLASPELKETGKIFYAQR
ncbi:MAG: SDR family oxidoreductase [Rickettsiales bacterium]|jgi:NAD(P)-dependent dehydrogenase (short-subunit alcohol dehydrogenase family)|nr:SDR family oxidoreductase [Rickettsiales bacterium]